MDTTTAPTVKDILLKGSELAAEGQHCFGTWFRTTGDARKSFSDDEIFDKSFSLDRALHSTRCAEGDLALAAFMLGGDWGRYWDAVMVVSQHLGRDLAAWNDGTLRSSVRHLREKQAQIEAGRQVAELFRTVADTLTD
jgi:hypothetical protein